MQASKPSFLGHLSILAVYFYRNALSPFMLGNCRFYPSCSEYALESMRAYGALRGWKRTLKRLMRCHPFSRGGLDPVR